MAILQNTGVVGSIHSLLVHPTKDDDITSEVVDKVAVSYTGFAGESHSGLTRQSCVRVKSQYEQGTEIRNTRQISIVSVEELATIAALLEIPDIQPRWLGANICIAGITDFTAVPPSSRLIFAGGVSLVVDMENEPCIYPAEVIDKHFPGRGKYFVKNASGCRGVTAWVEREGALTTGETVAVHAPRVRTWSQWS